MKRFLITILIFSLYIILPNFSYSNENPFLSNRKIEATKSEEISGPNFFNWIYLKLNNKQHKLNKEIARLTRDIKENRQPKSLFILIAISFLYGAFHSIGPGHGKCFVCSYFLSEKNDIKKGIMLGNLVAIIHALSAFTIVSVIYFVFKSQSIILFEDVSRSISIFSYGLIIVIGLSLLIKNTLSILNKKLSKNNVCNHEHHHNHECSHEHHENIPKNQNIFLVAASIGLVPCPGAITILLFSISLGVIQIGILLAFFIALGMGITVSLTGIFTILTRKGAIRVFSGQNKISKDIIENTMKILGSVMILCFGIFFLIGNL